MTGNEFFRLVKAHGLSGSSVEAARLVMVDGLSQADAARRAGIDKSVVTRALQKLRRPVCQCCGRPLTSEN